VSQKPNRRRVARSGLAGDWGNAMARRRSVLVRRGSSALAATLLSNRDRRCQLVAIGQDPCAAIRMGARGSTTARGAGRNSKAWHLADAGPGSDYLRAGSAPCLCTSRRGRELGPRLSGRGDLSAGSFQRDGGVVARQLCPDDPGTGWLVSAAMRAIVWFFAMRLVRAAEVEWSRLSGG